VNWSKQCESAEPTGGLSTTLELNGFGLFYVYRHGVDAFDLAIQAWCSQELRIISTVPNVTVACLGKDITSELSRCFLQICRD